MSAYLDVGNRVVVLPGVPYEGWRGVVTYVDGGERAVRFEVEGEPDMYVYVDCTDLASGDPCELVEVANGELWCDTHDSAAPCPIGSGDAI